LSENAKARLDLSDAIMERPASDDVSSASSPMDDAEAQMRRALGLDRGARSRSEGERAEPATPLRLPDRFNPAHRRRFVQDGDVQVAYVRREQQPETASRQAAQASPLAARLQRVEAALAAETAARQQVERGFADAQHTIRDLRTKLGHADLACNEAVEALRRERDGLAVQRAELAEQSARHQAAEEQVRTLQRELTALHSALDDERAQRRVLEKSLRAAEDAREAAERLVRVLSEEEGAATAATTPTTRRARKVSAKEPVVLEDQDPEPVKWWLNPPTTKRR
jgi:hypothetical protein